MATPVEPQTYDDPRDAGVDERKSSVGILDVDAAETAEKLRDLTAELLDEIVERARTGPGVDATRRFSEELDARMVALALTQTGMKENPRGSNNYPYSRYFGFGPQEWCADFVGWCVDQTGNKYRKVL